MRATNRLNICGEAADTPAFSHVCCGRPFYLFHIAVPRQSGVVDTVCVLAQERLLQRAVRAGDPVAVSGQIRTYRRVDDAGSRLLIVAYAMGLSLCTMPPENSAELTGSIWHEPVYRKTPLGREIRDLFLSVERAFGRHDTIPVIAWGHNARAAADWHAGDMVWTEGRLQSRVYRKDLGGGRVEERVAYEVSAARIERLPPPRADERFSAPGGPIE